MPRSRQSGAQRPYRYTHTWYTIENGERVRHERKRWRVRIELGLDSNGKRIRKTITADTSRECMDKLRKARAELRETGSIGSTRKPLFGVYYDMFMDNAKHRLAPGTYANYRTTGRGYLEEYRDRRIDRFTPLDVERLLDRIIRDGKSYSYMRHARTMLNQIFDLAVRDTVIPVNPVSSVKVRQNHTVSKRRAFTIPEIRAFLKATIPLGDDGAAIWWWRFMTGMRQAELLGAELDNLHLDADEPYYLLTGSLAFLPQDHGCGKADDGSWNCGRERAAYCTNPILRVPDGFVMRRLTNSLCIKRPKNGRSRWIPLSPELVEVTRRYLNAVRDRPNPLGLLFPNPDGSPRTVKQDNAEFDMLLEKAGMDPKQRTGHETRYSAVTLMRRAGVDRKAEREIIGHVDDRVDDMYMTVDAEQKMMAVEAIGRQLRLEPPTE